MASANKRSNQKKGKASPKKTASPLRSWLSRHKQLLIILFFVLGFGSIGSYLLSHSKAATPGAPGATYRVWTWNVAGQKMNKGKTTTGMTSAAVSSILARKVDLVSFNELCKNQYNDVQSQLKKAGWNASASFSHFAASRTDNSTCGGNDYGNAIFSKNGLGKAEVLKLAEDGSKERRNLLCATIADSTDTFCTTHITIQTTKVNGKPANIAQLGEVKDKLEQYYKNGRRVIIAGDFNAQPNYGRLNNWYAPSVATPANPNNSGAYREIDDLDARCLGYGEKTQGANNNSPCKIGSKIDFIFFRENLVSRYSGDTLTIANGCTGGACSDHRILYGSVTFK